jgi:hypothetical protein
VEPGANNKSDLVLANQICTELENQSITLLNKLDKILEKMDKILEKKEKISGIDRTISDFYKNV